jgi:hypothetical protein
MQHKVNRQSWEWTCVRSGSEKLSDFLQSSSSISPFSTPVFENTLRTEYTIQIQADICSERQFRFHGYEYWNLQS